MHFDEWTSTASRRYVNVILLSKTSFWNLGLIAFDGNATAENCLELVKSKLKQFDLDFNIICVTTDGCSVMKSIGDKIKPTGQQLCFAHAIQLAILDVLYLQIPGDEESTYDFESGSSDEENEKNEGDFVTDSNRDEEGSQDVDEPQDDDDGGIQKGGEITFIRKQPVPFSPTFDSIIKKVRAIVSLFRKSPLKNEKLQTYCKLQFGKRYHLLRDCRTRWSSLCMMLKRFHFLQDCI